MAKRKHTHLGSKNFFTLVVLSVSALGLMTFTYASQQKTNTESKAAEQGAKSCDRKPTLLLRGTEDHPNYVVYKLTLKNNNRTGKECLRQISRDYNLSKSIPKGWNAEFININNNEVDKLVNIDPSGYKKFEFKVIPPSSGAKPGKYPLSVKAKEILPPYYSDTIYLNYYKD